MCCWHFLFHMVTLPLSPWPRCPYKYIAHGKSGESGIGKQREHRPLMTIGRKGTKGWGLDVVHSPINLRLHPILGIPSNPWFLNLSILPMSILPWDNNWNTNKSIQHRYVLLQNSLKLFYEMVLNALQSSQIVPKGLGLTCLARVRVRVRVSIMACICDMHT